jgi:hypothetical protein
MGTAGVITGFGTTRVRRPDTGEMARIASVGFLSGVVIPYVFLAVLDVSLLVLELWRLWLNAAQPGAIPGHTSAGALLLALSRSSATVLKHFWRFRYLGIAMGAVGMMSAVAECYAARTGRGTRRATFLTVLGLSTFVTNAAAMLLQERRSGLAAAERLVFIYYQVSTSYWAVLIVGTSVAFLLAAVVWELWRVVYGRLAHGLRLSLPTPRTLPETSHPALARGPAEDRRIYQRRTHQLKLEAAQRHSSLPQQTDAAVGPTMRGRWWPMVLSLLVGMVLWVPIQGAYLRVAPRATSEVVCLKPDYPTDTVRLVVSTEPKAITFSSSTGQGIVDFHLEDRQGRVLRELEGFRLMDLPGIAYNTTTMSIADLPPGTYALRSTLRPETEEPTTESVIGESGGLISWSLLQGGGPWFRVLALFMAGLTTVLSIDVCLLLTRAGNWVRDRYL